MSGPYSQGGGGGTAGSATTVDRFALDKPYDISGVPSVEKMQQIDEMLRYLYTAITRAQDGIDATGAGDVVGPSSSIDGDVVMFNGTTGKRIADGSKLVSDLVVGPASAADGGIAQFDGTTGKLLADGGSFRTILADIGIVVGTLKLNTAQLDALNGTPITIIPAQGGNKQLMLVSFHATTTRSGAWSASPTYRAQYNGSTTALHAGSPGSLLAAAGAGSATSMAPAANGTTLVGSFPNTAIEVTFSVDTNPGAQTATAWIVVLCSVLDLT